jgi:hypothetical protein
MNSPLREICVAGGHLLAVAYEDGVAATLDFSEYLASHSGPIVEPLRDQEIFATARLDHGAVTWSTGRVCPDRETDAHFESQQLSAQ